MALIKSEMIITWYPGTPGTTDDPLVLLNNTTDRVEEGSLPEVFESQSDQPQGFVRSESRGNFSRGNNVTSFSFETVRSVTDPMTAMETALALAAGLPNLVGWVRLQLASKTAEWQIPDVVLNNVGGRPDMRFGKLYHPWTITGGKLAIYDAGASPPAVYTPGAIATEETTPAADFAILLEDAS